LTIHIAPLNKDCQDDPNSETTCENEIIAEPSDWKSTGFDDSLWDAASVHSNSDVSSKDGYDEVSWDPNAALIWGADLESHNTILCRFLVE